MKHAEWNRRDLFRTGTSAALALGLRSKADAARAGSRESGAIAFPGWRTGALAGPITWSRRSCAGGNTIAPDNYRHVEEAIDRGLNYLDTAPAYGRGRSELGYAR